MVNLCPEEEDFADHTPNIIRAGVNNRHVIGKESERLHETMISRDGGFIRDDPKYAVVMLVSTAGLANIKAIKKSKAIAGQLVNAEWTREACRHFAELVNGSHRTDILRMLNFELLERRKTVADHLKRLRLQAAAGVDHDKHTTDTDSYVQEMQLIHDKLEDRTTFAAKLLDIGNLIPREIHPAQLNVKYFFQTKLMPFQKRTDTACLEPLLQTSLLYARLIPLKRPSSQQ